MKRFDVIVIGGGTGLEIASFAAEQGLSVALVEDGPMGGTCLNRGCIPSKMLIHSADVAETIRNSQKFGITSKIEHIDFAGIVKRVSDHVDEEARQIEEGLKQSDKITLYKTKGKFISSKVMQVGNETITAEKLFIAGGTRPSLPQTKGIETITPLTSTEALRITEKPEHLVIIGGGYIACELAHFFGGLGTKITMLVRGDKLLSNEDAEIAEWFTKEFSKKYNVLFNAEVEEFTNQEDIQIKLKGKSEILHASHVLFTTGRKSNTDELEVAKTGVTLDEKGYVKVNDYLETNIEGIWALGDIVGILPFKHTANHQVGYAIQNAFSEHRHPVDYTAIGHGVFSSPQVAGVGKTEEEIKKEGIHYKVGKYELKDTGMGAALQQNGLIKVLVSEDDTILGVHIVGPDATTLIHEVIIAMKANSKIGAVTNAVYIHPALPEWLQRAFFAIE